jgi:hypothetical protein
LLFHDWFWFAGNRRATTRLAGTVDRIAECPLAAPMPTRFFAKTLEKQHVDFHQQPNPRDIFTLYA